MRDASPLGLPLLAVAVRVRGSDREVVRRHVVHERLGGLLKHYHRAAGIGEDHDELMPANRAGDLYCAGSARPMVAILQPPWPAFRARDAAE